MQRHQVWRRCSFRRSNGFGFMDCWLRAECKVLLIHQSMNPLVHFCVTVYGWRGLRARRFFAVAGVPSLRIHEVPVAGRCLRVRRSLAVPGDSLPRIRVGAGEMPGLPTKQFGAVVLRSLPRIHAVTGGMNVRPVRRFCAVVLNPWPRNHAVRGFCGASGVLRRQHRRSGVGCGVTQIPFWATASGLVTYYGLRRPWCAVVSLS